MKNENSMGFSYTAYPRRYKVTFVDTADDSVFRIAYSDTVQGVKQLVTAEMRTCGLPGYDPLCSYAVYVSDAHWDHGRLRSIRFLPAEDVLQERGLDYDTWLYDYLPDDELSWRDRQLRKALFEK